MGSDQVPAVHKGQVPAFSVDNNLTVADILSVAVGEAEAKLQKILKEGMAKNKVVEARIKQVGKDIDTQLDALKVSCGLQAEIDATNVYLKKLFDGEISSGISVDRSEKRVVFTYSFAHSHSRKNVPFTPEITRLMDLLDSEKESLEQARADVAETRKKLANIPALERRYRGKLVASQLERTAEGKNVLQVITDNIEEELRNI